LIIIIGSISITALSILSPLGSGVDTTEKILDSEIFRSAKNSIIIFYHFNKPFSWKLILRYQLRNWKYTHQARENFKWEQECASTVSSTKNHWYNAQE
jgi:hypothetical protein